MFLEKENNPKSRFCYNDSRVSYLKGNSSSIFYDNKNYKSNNIKKPIPTPGNLTSFQKKMISMYDISSSQLKEMQKKDKSLSRVSSRGFLFKSKDKPLNDNSSNKITNLEYSKRYNMNMKTFNMLAPNKQKPVNLSKSFNFNIDKDIDKTGYTNFYSYSKITNHSRKNSVIKFNQNPLNPVTLKSQNNFCLSKSLNKDNKIIKNVIPLNDSEYQTDIKRSKISINKYGKDIGNTRFNIYDKKSNTNIYNKESDKIRKIFLKKNIK